MSMKRFVSLALSVFFYVTITAQDPCASGRFSDKIFTSYDSVTVTYGQATTLGGTNKTLKMDIYSPAGDTASKRPVVVLAHGGSFIFGSRTEMRHFCRDLALRGYIAATIDYRLLDAWVSDSIGMAEEVVMAISDMKAAIRYFREDAATTNTLKADTHWIFSGGLSAGGIIGSHVGFMDSTDPIPAYIQNHINNHGGFQGESSTNTGYSSSVQGVVNLSGGLSKLNFIDADDVVLYSVHDENDPTVPCNTGTTNAVTFPVYLSGSCVMNDRCTSLGIRNSLRLYPGSSGHISYVVSDFDTIMQEASEFLAQEMCTTTSLDDEAKIAESTIWPNPAASQINWRKPVESYSVYDIQGRMLYEVKLNGAAQAELNIESGVYVISSVYSDKSSNVQKLIVE